ncbi:hypothetical protein FIBSPDRAFT_356581 [Athelia psychrophila]|uniref:Uncharacterized protein n=1 Tax=Athelia psychrophila TaxID=1759441 RepID=A0A167VSI2_9AGAM|nr:hypothetical protein FIBSPDRAFT_356581 [Fibularhizoctonia sp. CBS 109695]
MLWSVPARSLGKVLRAMGASVRVCFFAAEVALDPGGETTRWNIAPGYIVSDPDPLKASTTVPILVASSSSRCNHMPGSSSLHPPPRPRLFSSKARTTLAVISSAHNDLRHQRVIIGSSIAHSDRRATYRSERRVPQDTR